MGFSCGIVGLPNVGKSTLFNSLTNSRVMAENYPFCTVDRNTGTVPVPDPRLATLAGLVAPRPVVPASMTFVDIAGLIRGAARGEGLGNQFLAHIREVDSIAHVVRCFHDPDVAHVESEVDPVRDVEIIEVELKLADLETASRSIDRVRRRASSGDKEAAKRLRALEKVRDGLERNHGVADQSLPDEDRQSLRDCQFLTDKPVLFLANLDEDRRKSSRSLHRLRSLAGSRSAEVVSICGKVEAEIAELEARDRAEFLKELGYDEPGLNRFVRAGYRLLGLHSFFTVGLREARAWTIARGTDASKAAGAIHTDFETGFIRAEVVSFADFATSGGETKAKAAGKWRLEGRDYVVADGDVIYFRFNV